MERLEAIVTGKVQGVTYREFVQRAAERLGLVGEVENLIDRSVRVIAEGERGILDALVTELQMGPYFSDVLNVGTSYTKATKKFSSFDIVRA